MAYSHTKHFWTWFQHNSDTLLKAHKMDKKEQEFWLREIHTHLRAYTKKLNFAIVWDDNGVSRFIISADGNARYFNMAEKFVAKAPPVPGWQIFGLQPSNMVPDQLVEQQALKAGIDLNKCWFTPPALSTFDGKAILTIYAEIFVDITYEMQEVIGSIIANWLGEKTMALEVSDFLLESVFHRSDDDKEKELIPLHELPQHIICRETSTVFINEQGNLINRYP